MEEKFMSTREAAYILGVSKGQIKNWTAKGHLVVAKKGEKWRRNPTNFYSTTTIEAFKTSDVYRSYKPRKPRKKDEVVVEPIKTAENHFLPAEDMEVLKQVLAWFKVVHYKPKTVVTSSQKKEYCFVNQDRMPPPKAFDGFQELRDILLSYIERSGSNTEQTAALVSSHRQWTYGVVAPGTISLIMNGKFTWNKQQGRYYAPMSTGKMRRMAFLLKPFIPTKR